MANTTALSSPDPRWQSASTLPSTSLDPHNSPLQLPALKSLIQNGLTRSEITEINGLRSSGKSSVCWHILAEATTRGEVCAIVDWNNSFHPLCAAAVNVQLDRLVWVRCSGNLKYALRATDLLVHAGGFGVVLLDLCEASPRALNRIPLSYWYRFRKALEHTPSILLICAEQAQAKSCSRNSLQLKPKAFNWSGQAPLPLFRELETQVLHRKISFIRPESLLIPALV
jgi:hypothetical protein